MNDGVTLADRFTSVTVIFLLGFRFWLKVVSFDIFIEIEINSRDFFLQMFRIAVADAAARSYHNMSERLRLAGNLILFVPKS